MRWDYNMLLLYQRHQAEILTKTFTSGKYNEALILLLKAPRSRVCSDGTSSNGMFDSKDYGRGF